MMAAPVTEQEYQESKSCSGIWISLWLLVRISPYTHHVPWQLSPKNPYYYLFIEHLGAELQNKELNYKTVYGRLNIKCLSWCVVFAFGCFGPQKTFCFLTFFISFECRDFCVPLVSLFHITLVTYTAPTCVNIFLYNCAWFFNMDWHCRMTK